MTDMQLHYSETPLGSVLRQWETADMMKHVPADWTLPVAISAALYNNNVIHSSYSSHAPEPDAPPAPTMLPYLGRDGKTYWMKDSNIVIPITASPDTLSAGPTDPCAP